MTWLYWIVPAVVAFVVMAILGASLIGYVALAVAIAVVVVVLEVLERRRRAV